MQLLFKVLDYLKHWYPHKSQGFNSKCKDALEDVSSSASSVHWVGRSCFPCAVQMRSALRHLMIYLTAGLEFGLELATGARYGKSRTSWQLSHLAHFQHSLCAETYSFFCKEIIFQGQNNCKFCKIIKKEIQNNWRELIVLIVKSLNCLSCFYKAWSLETWAAKLGDLSCPWEDVASTGCRPLLSTQTAVAAILSTHYIMVNISKFVDACWDNNVIEVRKLYIRT